MRRGAILLAALALVASAGCSDDDPAATRPGTSTTTAAATPSTLAPTTTLPPGPTLPQLPLDLRFTMDGVGYSLQASQLTFPAYRVADGGTLAWDLTGAPTGSLESSADPRSVPPDTEVRIGALLAPPAEAAAVTVPPGGNDTAGGWCSPAADPAVVGSSAAASWTPFVEANGLGGDLVCGSLFAAAVGRPAELLGPSSGSAPLATTAAAAEAFARHITPAGVIGYLVAVGSGGFSFLGTCAVLVRPGAAPVLHDPTGRCSLA